VVVVIVTVSILLVTAPANSDAELLAFGVQLFCHALDNAVVSIGRIVVVVGQRRDDRRRSHHLFSNHSTFPSSPPYIAFFEISSFNLSQ
jgi:hypothetical protein